MLVGESEGVGETLPACSWALLWRRWGVGSGFGVAGTLVTHGLRCGHGSAGSDVGIEVILLARSRFDCVAWDGKSGRAVFISPWETGLKAGLGSAGFF